MTPLPTPSPRALLPPSAPACWVGTALWVIVWNARTAEDPDAMVVPPGLPVRVLLEGDARLPEHAFLACRDLKTARVADGHAAFHQVRAWLEELYG